MFICFIQAENHLLGCINSHVNIFLFNNMFYKNILEINSISITSKVNINYLLLELKIELWSYFYLKSLPSNFMFYIPVLRKPSGKKKFYKIFQNSNILDLDKYIARLSWGKIFDFRTEGPKKRLRITGFVHFYVNLLSINIYNVFSSLNISEKS